MKSLLTIFVLVSVFFIQNSAAQIKEAEKLVEKGNKHYNRQHFQTAREFYFKALKVDSNHVKANFYVGVELLEADEKWKSLPYIKKAFSIDPEADDQLDFYLGMAYQYNYEFKKALHHLEEAKRTPKKYNKEEWDEIHRRIEQCITSLNLLGAERKFHVVNLGPKINSPFSDYAPVIAPTQEKIILTSNRTDGKKKSRDNEYFMNIYMSERDENSWKAATKVDKSLNSKYDDMGLSFDNEGKTLLIYNSSVNNGDIFISNFRNGKWSKPLNLGEKINTEKFTETSACLSSDGNTLFFASNRSGGLGGMDIYFSYRKEDGLWSKSQNIGQNINSMGNEEAPFISADGNILFFSSNGHSGIGGFDVYYSLRDKNTGEWGKPVNMGFPINTPQDDINFVLAKDGLTGYYSATRNDTYGGEDIYKVTMLAEINENPSLLASIYKDALELNHNDIFRKEDMKNLVDVNFQTAIVSNQNIQNNNPKILFRNIYFNTAEAGIDSADLINLNRIAEYMKTYSGIKLELDGHADGIGSDAVNLNLSKERAESVFQYLVSKGVSPFQLKITAHGKNMPLASNDDEREGRELNRRVEFNLVPYNNERSIIRESTYASNAN